MTEGSGPLSWRDVYTAVRESEQRITDTIREAVGPLRKTSDDHEVRLRAVEAGDMRWHKEVVDTLAKHGDRLNGVENTLDTFRDREHGILTTVSFGQKLLITVIAVAGVIIAALNVLAISAAK